MVILTAMFFWLYKKKKVSGKNATILFFVVKGTISTVVILFGIFSLWGNEDKGSDIPTLIDASELSISVTQPPRITELKESNSSLSKATPERKNTFESLSSFDENGSEIPEDDPDEKQGTETFEDD